MMKENETAKKGRNPMNYIEKFSGIYPATITPFTEDNRINKEAMLTLMRRNIREGAKGLFIGGSSAECFLMSREERLQTFEIAAELKGECVLIAHVGALSTDEAILYAMKAEELGYDAIAATPPFYYGHGSKAICQYYYDIYEACGMPIIIYNFPGNTGKEFNLADPEFRELFKSPAIMGVKHTNQIVYQLEQIKRLNPELVVLNGFDETMVAGFALGANGSIGSTFNFMYPHYQKVRDAFFAKDLEEALRLQIKANAIMNTLVDIGLFPSIKYILNKQGIDAGLPRRPFLPLTEEQKAIIDKVLEENLENE